MHASCFSIVMSSTVMACGDAGSSMTMALGAAERAEACGQFCGYLVECGLPDERLCLPWCEVVAGLIRGDAARALVDCYVGAGCEPAVERVCLADVINTTDPSATYDEAVAICHDTEGRCGVRFACDASYFVVLADPTLEELIGCFGLGCSDVEPCLIGVFDPT